MDTNTILFLVGVLMTFALGYIKGYLDHAKLEREICDKR